MPLRASKWHLKRLVNGARNTSHPNLLLQLTYQKPMTSEILMVLILRTESEIRVAVDLATS